MGVDPYPWHNSTTSTNLTWQAQNADALEAAFGATPTRSTASLAQAFDWARHVKCASGFPAMCNSSFPSDGALRAMTFLHVVLGSRGVMMYSYLGLYGWPEDQLPAKTKSQTKLSEAEVQRRKGVVARVTTELAKLAREVLVPLDREGICDGQRSQACAPNVYAARFSAADGSRSTTVVVNGQSTAAAWAGAGKHCGAEPLRLAPWAVVRCDQTRGQPAQASELLAPPSGTTALLPPRRNTPAACSKLLVGRGT